MIMTLASIGMPALDGFIGEFLTMLGAYRWDPRYVVGAGLGVILSAVYMLWMFQRVYLGEVTNEKNLRLPDLQPREWATVIPLCAIAIFMGVAPTIFTAPMGPAVNKMVERVQSVRPVRVQTLPSAGPVADARAVLSSTTPVRTDSNRHAQH
jgi:NADH-quinone oxidoreductase subunit M